MISKMANALVLSLPLLIQLIVNFCMLEEVYSLPNIVFILTDDQDIEIGGMVSLTLRTVCMFPYSIHLCSS